MYILVDFYVVYDLIVGVPVCLYSLDLYVCIYFETYGSLVVLYHRCGLIDWTCGSLSYYDRNVHMHGLIYRGI